MRVLEHARDTNRILLTEVCVSGRHIFHRRRPAQELLSHQNLKESCDTSRVVAVALRVAQ